ncbi:MAG: tetratricopeptide repeat protein [Planctomycetota bacterium]|nr:tetratricopeptide repeat protein [Planctomycetota bacterium]
MAKPKTRHESMPPRRLRAIVPSLALIGLTLLAYLPALRGGFIWDDPDYVTQNATLRSLDGLRQIWFVPRSIPQYYPMVHTTFWFEYQLWQLWSPGYHAVNVLLHATAAVLLLAVLRKLAFPAAWLAAAVFALHPVHVESVAWVTERKNVLSAVFYLAAMLAYFRFDDPTIEGDERNWRAYGVALGLFVLALLSKTVTCSLPAAILLVVWWKRGRITLNDVKPLMPLFLVGAGFAFATAYFEKAYVGATGAEFGFSSIDHILIAGRAVWFYRWKLIAPVNLAFIYPRWNIDPAHRWQLLYPLAGVLTLLSMFVLRRRIGRGPLVAFLFFGGTLLPALGFVNVYPMRYSFVADHFQYLASIGPIVLLVAILRRLAHRTTPYMPVFLIPLGLITFQQAKIYRNTETLWKDTAAKNPDSWMVHTNLGHALVERRAYDEGQEEYERALQLAPHLPEPHWNVGIGLSVRGDYEGALRHFDEAIRLSPNFPQGYFSRGNVFRERGQLDEAMEQYEQAVALKRDYAEAYYNLGVIAEGQKRLDDAIRYYALAVANKLEYEAGHYSLANLLFMRGRFDEAQVHYSQVIRINPRRAEAHVNLGATFLKMGRYDEARRAFMTALAIDPNLRSAQQGMQRVMQLRGP